MSIIFCISGPSGAGKSSLMEEKEKVSPSEIKNDLFVEDFNMGVIYDDEIENLLIKYTDQEEFQEVTMIEIETGRIWFSFSETPIDYDPELLKVYKNVEKEVYVDE